MVSFFLRQNQLLKYQSVFDHNAQIISMQIGCFRYLDPNPDRRINVVDVRQWEKDTILVCYDDELYHRHNSESEYFLQNQDSGHIQPAYADRVSVKLGFRTPTQGHNRNGRKFGMPYPWDGSK